MADETNTIDLRFLARQNEKILKELAALRRDVSNSTTLSMQNLEYSRRIERRLGEVDERVSQTSRRIDELKDDLELTIKAEIGGSLANFESRIEAIIFDALGNTPT
jgi:hypothetical protein